MKTVFIIPVLALLITCHPTSKPMTAGQQAAVKEEAALVIADVFKVLSYYSTWTFRKSADVWKMINGHESFRLPLRAEE